MLKQIDHLGLVVRDLEASIKTYEQLGYRVRMRGELEGGATKVAFVDPPGEGAAIEIMQPTPGVGMLGTFLQERGPGIHHVAFWVEDVDKTLAQLDEQGFQCMDKQSKEGVGGSRIAYAGERDGILIQLINR